MLRAPICRRSGMGVEVLSCLAVLVHDRRSQSMVGLLIRRISSDLIA